MRTGASNKKGRSDIPNIGREGMRGFFIEKPKEPGGELQRGQMDAWRKGKRGLRLTVGVWKDESKTGELKMLEVTLGDRAGGCGETFEQWHKKGRKTAGRKY